MSDHIKEGPADEKPSEVVVTEVAAATSSSPLDLPPLAEAIDPDALNRLVEGDRELSTTVTFRYAGRTVTVTPRTVEVK
jgi:hypothetical protein